MSQHEEPEREPLLIDVATCNRAVQRTAVRVWLRILRYEAGLGGLWLPDRPARRARD